MSEVLGKVNLTGDKVLSLVQVEKLNLFDIRLSLLFQKFIPVAYLEDYLSDKKVINIRVNHRSVGYIFLCRSIYKTEFFHPKSYILDYSIKRLYRGKKIGQNALGLLFSEDVSQKVDSTRYIAYIDTQNIASIRCMEKQNVTRVEKAYVKDIEH
ncbi:MAG: hypothetical protein Q4D02_02930 [Clostridia bacterium]|nr:hypothetical protein [Clostridia bacterium]